MDRYFDAHPKVKTYLEQTSREALTTGVGRTLVGRIRWFGDVTVLRGSKRRTVGRKAKNFPMQGTCADGLKLALALLYERRHECPGAVPIIALHDEIVVECDEGDVEKVKVWLEMTMKDGMDEVVNGCEIEGPRVPIEVEIKSGKTWLGSFALRIDFKSRYANRGASAENRLSPSLGVIHVGLSSALLLLCRTCW
jgi:DNA polymerase I-like protein with 3'-5' exonuclease and polymerase domains